MTVDESASLEQQFSQLPFALAADNWLKSIPGKSVAKQLRERKISTIRFVPLISSGGLGIQKGGANFFVLLNDINSPQENAQTLGHEIGHTFLYNLNGAPSQPFSLRYKKDAEELIEEFCYQFSSAWLAKNDAGNVILRCRNQAQLIQI